jgi:hypothetical protein
MLPSYNNSYGFLNSKIIYYAKFVEWTSMCIRVSRKYLDYSTILG